MAANHITRGTAQAGRVQAGKVDAGALTVDGQELTIPQEVADAANVATVVTALKAAGIFVDPA